MREANILLLEVLLLMAIINNKIVPNVETREKTKNLQETL